MIRRLALAVGILGFVACSAQASCPPGGPTALQVRFMRASLSGEVFVVDGAGCRYLRFGSPYGRDQSVLSLSDPGSVPTEYVRLAALGLAIAERTERVLVVGLGGGTFTRLVARASPDVEIDAVEIDPVVVEAAARFFGVRAGPGLRVHVADAAAFLTETEVRFDLIFLDTYGADGLPAHLGTKTYFESAVRRLQPGGIVVANFGLSDPGTYVALARRLRAAAGAALCASGREDANLVVFAGAAGALLPGPVPDRAARLDAEGRLPFPLRPLAARLRACL